MSVTRSVLSSSVSIDPFYLKIEKSTDFIVINDMPPMRAASRMQTQIDDDTVWIKVQSGHQMTVLFAAPDSVTQVGLTHENWDMSRVLIKDDDIFVIEYGDTPFSDEDRVSVIGYAFGSSDTVYIKIDQTANTISIYQ